MVDLVLYNGEGFDLGSLDGRQVFLDEVGSELTVRAITSQIVDYIDFYFDGEYVNRENREPYYLNQDNNEVGFAYPPLATPGTHNVTCVADEGGSETGRQTAIFVVSGYFA